MSSWGRTKVGVRWNQSGLEGQMDYFGKANGNTVMTITDGGVILPSLGDGIKYYVESNTGVDTKSGRGGFGNAMKTLTVAIAASNASIVLSPLGTGRGFAARNKIYYKGDSNTEALTTLANKCDIIGVGSGGGHRARATIVGEHVISANAYVACRFINMGFLPENNNGDIFTLPTGLNGTTFLDCDFESENGAAIAGSAIVAVGGNNMRIEGCTFGVKFTDSVLEFTASGISEQFIIKNNTIIGAEKGIEFITGLTSSNDYSGPLVEGNTIHTALICIEDADQDKVRVVRNNCITAGADGTAGIGIIKCNVKTAVDNKVTSADGQNADFPIPSSIS